MIMCTVQLLRLKFTVTVSDSFDFFSFFFCIHYKVNELRIYKKKKVLASNFIHVRKKITIVIVDYYSRNFGKL